MISEKELKHIAQLAHIEFKDESMDKMAKDMENIVSMVDKLNEVDISGFNESLINFDKATVWRSDEPHVSNTNAEVIENAKNKKAGCVVVPRVVE